MTDAQIEAAASELSKRNYRTLCDAEIAAIIRKHAVEELPEGVEVAGSFSTWWIVRDVIGGHEYLRRDGKWHCTNCFGANGGYWPTREAAIEFIRKVAGEVGK